MHYGRGRNTWHCLSFWSGGKKIKEKRQGVTNHLNEHTYLTETTVTVYDASLYARYIHARINHV